MKTTNDHVLETVGLNLRPVLNLVRGNVLGIAGHVVRGVGVGTLGTDGSHQFVVLIGDEVLGSHLADAVDARIGHSTLLGVGQLAILFIALLNVSQQRSLLRRVRHAKLTCTLKHQML